MFGAELPEFVSFLKQLGLALAGAAALWGAVFAYKSENHSEIGGIIDTWVARKLSVLLYGGVMITTVAWVWQLMIYEVSLYAHEGIVIHETASQVKAALEMFTPVFYIWIVFSLAGLLLQGVYREWFSKNFAGYYLTHFVFSSVLISFPALSGSWDLAQFFFFGHSFHSIMTVGTVLVLDYLFLVSKPSDILKQHIYPMLPVLSKVIWLGLGLEFLSTYLVFEEAAVITSKFLFMQVAVAILIINGVFLAGPVLRRLLQTIRENARSMTKRWQSIADVSGAISISSWLSITFVDFFDHLTLSFSHFLGAYLTLIGIVILGHWCFEHLPDTFKVTLPERVVKTS